MLRQRSQSGARQEVAARRRAAAEEERPTFENETGAMKLQQRFGQDKTLPAAAKNEIKNCTHAPSRPVATRKGKRARPSSRPRFPPTRPTGSRRRWNS
jgi:hypothetical protein